MGGSLHQNKTLQLTIFHYNILILEFRKIIIQKTSLQCVCISPLFLLCLSNSHNINMTTVVIVNRPSP